MRYRLLLTIGFILALLFTFSSTRVAHAATLTVTSTADSGAGTLRNAIASAASGDTINFSLSYPATITLTSGTLSITQNLTIQGPGAALLAVDGNNAVEVFYTAIGTVNLSGLTIKRGNSANSGGGIYNVATLTVSNSVFSGNSANYGGAIYSQATLTVSNSVFSGNSANFSGGGIFNQGTLTVSNSTVSGNSANYGSGIYTLGTLTVSNSTVSGNSATNYGGGIYNYSGTLTVSNSTVSGNSAFSLAGGIYNGSGNTLNLGSSIVSGNTVSSGGPDLSGAITSLGYNLIGSTSGASGFVGSDQQNVNPLLNGLANNGGPTQTMSLQVSSLAIGAGNCNLGSPASPVSTDQRGATRKTPACDVGAYETAYDPVVHDTQDHGGGSLRQAIKDAPPGTTITFDPLVFNTAQTITLTSGTLSITQNLTIQGPGAALLAVDGNNAVEVFYTAIGTVNLSGLTIKRGNSANSGGGIYNVATLTVSNSVFSGNSANYGGAIYSQATLTVSNSVFSGNSANFSGGGIFNQGTLTVSNSTVSGNSANYGSGIYTLGTLTISNSTVSGNSATNYGGGIYNYSGTLTVSNSTVSGNSAFSLAGGIYNGSGNTLNLGSSIVSGNTVSSGGPDLSGAITSLGYNLIGSTSGASGFVGSDQQNVNPLLNGLANNGGPTQTMSLQASSLAIGAGNCALGAPASPVSTDQRGATRKTPACDVGAYETAYDAVVHDTQDHGGGSLRQAINDAPPGTTITFDPLVFNTPQTITLTSGTLTIAKNLTIQGPGANLLAVDGNNGGGVFYITSATVNLSGLTIQHGNLGFFGGGIDNYAGTLTVSNSTVSGNSANTGGGIYNQGTLTVSNSAVSGNSTSGGSGGGIFNYAGTLTVSNSTVSGNSTSGGSGGGIFNYAGTLTVSNSTVSGNSAFSLGGGIFNQATLNLGSSIVSGNTASTGPDISGAITSLGANLIGSTSGASGFVGSDQQNVDPLLNGLANNGGPTQTMSLQASSLAIGMGNCALGAPASPISTDQRGVARKIPACDVGAYETAYDAEVHNTQDHGGGSLRQAINDAPQGAKIRFDQLVFNKPQTITLTSGTLTIVQNLIIQGPGAKLLTVDGNKSVTVFTITSGTVSISDLTIQRGNSANGGGIYNDKPGALTVSNSVFSSNAASNLGGAIFNQGTLTISSSTLDGNNASGGGGIENANTLTVSDSTFSGNSTSGGSGGGIENTGALAVSNSTFFGNGAANLGGGIFNQSTLTVSNSTLSSNSAGGSSSGGGIYNFSGSTLILGSTIVSGNTHSGSGADDIHGVVTSLGANLIGSTSGASGFVGSDQQNVNPLLNGLANNGGPTQTMSLQASSLAIGTGNCALGAPASPVSTDQRGVTRKLSCDVGAYETAYDAVVHNTNDHGGGSLRTVISGAPPGTTITFDPLVFNTAQTIGLTSGTLTITRNVTIQGPGTSQLAVDGSNAGQVFTISSGTVSLSGLTIQHGNSASGGGIANAGTLTVSNSTLSSNFATSGSGIYNTGTLTVSNSTLSGNFATSGGGIYNTGTLTVSNSTLSGNSATNIGGGIYNNSGHTLNLGSTIVSGNTASSGAPDISGVVTSLGYNLVGSTSGASGFVGRDQQNVDPLLNGLANNGGPTQTMSLQATSLAIGMGNCALGLPISTDQRGVARKTPACDVGAYETAYDAVVHNANDHGGGSLRTAISDAPPGTTITFDPLIFNTAQTITLTSGTLTIARNMTIRGTGANQLAVDGNQSKSVFAVNNGVTATITGLTVQHGNTGGNGGGIVNAGTLTINNGAMSGNSASGSGGGLLNLGTLTINASTISGNSAGESGGGLYSSGTTRVNNSTVAGNLANDGGGITNLGTLIISYSTVAQNSAQIVAGIDNSGTLTLGSSLVGMNTGSVSDIKGGVVSLGNNLIGVASAASGLISSDQQNVDPKLNALANNGGTTQTISLQTGSPAIKKGNCKLNTSGVTPVTLDQRGEVRKAPCDVGAFESSTAFPTLTRTPSVTRTPSRTITPTNTKTPTATRTATSTRTNTATPTVSRTPTISKTPTVSRTPTVSKTPTVTRTPTSTRTLTLTRTPTSTRTTTATRTPTRTRTPTATVTAAIPGTVTLIAPVGVITNIHPTYQWTANIQASQYYLWVSGTGGRVFDGWFSSSNCTAGICSVTPAQALTNGPYTFWVETWNSSYYGPWSAGLNFTVTGQTPDQAIQLSPSGAISNAAATFTWQTATNGEWYYLLATGPGNVQVAGQWYDGTVVCGGATCSVTPTLALGNGTYTWWILTWGGGIFGPMSSGMAFTESGLPPSSVQQNAPTFAPSTN